MRVDDIEDAILSAFLFCNDPSKSLDEAFKLEISVFSTKYRQRVAERINSVEDGYYGLLSIELEEKSLNTQYEMDFMQILEQTPLTFELAEKYYLHLEKKVRFERIV